MNNLFLVKYYFVSYFLLIDAKSYLFEGDWRGFFKDGPNNALVAGGCCEGAQVAEEGVRLLGEELFSAQRCLHPEVASLPLHLVEMLQQHLQSTVFSIILCFLWIETSDYYLIFKF